MTDRRKKKTGVSKFLTDNVHLLTHTPCHYRADVRVMYAP